MEDSLIEKLKFSDVFSDNSIKRVKDHSELIPDIGEYKSGEIVHLTGEKCDRMEILISGEALVQSLTEQGNVLTVNDLSIGSVMGASLLFSQKPFYPMSVFAKTDILLLCFSKYQVLELCKDNQFLENLLSTAADKTTTLTGKIRVLKQKSLREQIVNFLKAQYQLQKSLKIKLPVTKKELANRFGVRRTSLSRELLKMKRVGLVDYDPKHIIIRKEKIVRDK